MLEKIFKLKNFNTDFKSEVLAGITTFITMAYIIFVNPQMMAASGMDIGASFVGTCIAASIACIAMGVYANWPVGLAPGMAGLRVLTGPGMALPGPNFRKMLTAIISQKTQWT